MRVDLASEIGSFFRSGDTIRLMYSPYPQPGPVIGTDGILDIIKAPFKAAAKAGSAITKVVSKVPIAGDIMNIANKQVTAPFRIASDIVSGKNIKDVVSNATKGQIEYVQKTAPYVQAALPLIPAGQMQAILSKGQEAVASVPALSSAAKTVSAGAQSQGFQLAAGLIHSSGIDEKTIAAIRGKLPADVVKGFDTALRTRAAPMKTAATSAQASAKALAALTPEQQKQLVDYANLQKLAQLTPDQQKQLVDYAKARAPAAPASKPAAKPAVVARPALKTPPKTSAAVTRSAAPAPSSSPGSAQYKPYPSS
jgi:hypothetical protein